jgi:glutamine synthetase
MPELGLISSPTPNAMKRRQPYTFCPTNNCWGADNRTVGLRVIEGSPAAVRIEQRDGSADANPYLLLGAQMAAGLWGIENDAEPGEMETGNGYENTTAIPLPTNTPAAIELFRNSELLAGLIPAPLFETMIQQAEREQQFMIDSGEDDLAGTVTQVERDRYLDNF